MIQLFLSKPIWSNEVDDDDDSSKQKKSIFNQLGNIVWKFMTSEGRSEARLWLCDAISSFASITSREKHDLFFDLLRLKSARHSLAAQLWRMIFEKRPHRAGLILSKKSHLLEKFFEGHPRRILQWFSNFSAGRESEHGKGARALSQFAFVNRDICWEELEWKGKHGQSPAVVATKPHYFLDLDVQQTVENFLENVPEFWSSDEFAESLKGGEILFIDTKFFVDLFIDLMYKDHFKEVWEAVSEFLMEESFSYLCHHLLIIIDERDLCFFLGKLQDVLSRKKEVKFDNSSYWLEILLSKCSDHIGMDQLLLLNALFNKGRQLLRLLQSNEAEEEKMIIKDLVLKFCTTANDADILALISKDALKTNVVEMFRLMGLLSWILLYRMSEECHSPESWESLFVLNGIDFRLSDKFDLLQYDRGSDDSGSESNERAVTRVKRKKRQKSRSKRKRKFDGENVYDDELLHFDDELLDFNDSGNGLNLQCREGGWLLSIDGFSTPWSLVDLPEYLSKHCLSTWMKQAFTNLNETAAQVKE